MGLCENIFYSMDTMDTMEEEFGRCMHGCSSIFVFLRAYSTAHVYINPNTFIIKFGYNAHCHWLKEHAL